MKVLLTCFEPFGGNATNVSSDVASTFSPYSIEGCEIVVAQLPVSFLRVGEFLSQLIELHQPDIILMLGQASSREKISIERIAINLMDSKMGDNDGYCPNEQTIIQSSDNALFSNLPLKTIVENWRNAGIESAISNSAGLYVCNCSLYYALSISQGMESNSKVGFIHLPQIRDIERKSMLLEYMHKAVAIAIKCIIS